METNLEKRINETEEILNCNKNVGFVNHGNNMVILENQLAIMKELRELKLDTKKILSYER